MKTPSARIESFFKKEMQEQPVRLIKASQTGKVNNGAAHTHAAGDVHKKPEIRLVSTSAEYCDLEVICGCGESTRVRCWNSPAAEQKTVAA